jgi:RIO-like serine/threonine protein kinase
MKKTEQTPNTSQSNDTQQSEITQTILNEVKTCSKCGMVHIGECK